MGKRPPSTCCKQASGRHALHLVYAARTVDTPNKLVVSIRCPLNNRMAGSVAGHGVLLNRRCNEAGLIQTTAADIDWHLTSLLVLQCSVRHSIFGRHWFRALSHHHPRPVILVWQLEDTHPTASPCSQKVLRCSCHCREIPNPHNPLAHANLAYMMLLIRFDNTSCLSMQTPFLSAAQSWPSLSSAMTTSLLPCTVSLKSSSSSHQAVAVGPAAMLLVTTHPVPVP